MAAPAPGGPSAKQASRIQRDLDALQQNSLSFVKDVEKLVEDGVHQLKGILVGPDGSDYANQEYKFLLRFPPEYPFRIPDFYFTSPISHPNVDKTTGTVCHDQLMASWAPNVPLSTLLTGMHDLLANPNPTSPINASS